MVGDGSCDGNWDGGCIDVAGSVGSDVVFAAFFVFLVAFAIASVAGSVVLWIEVFPLSNHPGPPFFLFVWVVPSSQGWIGVWARGFSRIIVVDVAVVVTVVTVDG